MQRLAEVEKPLQELKSVVARHGAEFELQAFSQCLTDAEVHINKYHILEERRRRARPRKDHYRIAIPRLRAFFNGEYGRTSVRSPTCQHRFLQAWSEVMGPFLQKATAPDEASLSAPVWNVPSNKNADKIIRRHSEISQRVQTEVRRLIKASQRDLASVGMGTKADDE
jgi:hypothetical protein